ncbi:MAG: DUF167 domain-containing protein [Minisyncoccia bacterium]
MKIVVKVKPNSKVESVERVTQASLGFISNKNDLVEYSVRVKEPPVGGKANDAVVRALANYFDAAPSLVRLVKGGSTKRKIFEIDK